MKALTKLPAFSLLLTFFLTTAPAHALELGFDGELDFCTATCDSFEALGGAIGGAQNSVNSLVVGSLNIPVNANATFDFSIDDDIPFAFFFSNTAADAVPPIIGPDAACPSPNVPGRICNATSANPLPLNNATGTISGNGVIGADGLPASGTLFLRWLRPPFADNGIEVQIDLATGTGSASLFGGVIMFFQFEGSFSNSDSDGDGIADNSDNCVDQPNSQQRDSDADGYGNRCDADLDNNCIINVVDLGLLRSVFFSANANADFNGDNAVNIIDLGILRSSFFGAPGPSAVRETCTPQ
ncbi:MAG: hypothetical protein AB8G16_11930 [Gammaproteobacteria bacterium]